MRRRTRPAPASAAAHEAASSSSSHAVFPAGVAAKYEQETRQGAGIRTYSTRHRSVVADAHAEAAEEPTILLAQAVDVEEEPEEEEEEEEEEAEKQENEAVWQEEREEVQRDEQMDEQMEARRAQRRAAPPSPLPSPPATDASEAEFAPGGTAPLAMTVAASRLPLQAHLQSIYARDPAKAALLDRQCAGGPRTPGCGPTHGGGPPALPLALRRGTTTRRSGKRRENLSGGRLQEGESQARCRGGTERWGDG